AAWIAGGSAAVLALAVSGVLLLTRDDHAPAKPTPSSSPQRLTLSQVSQRAQPSVVGVEAEGADGVSGGTGFFIRGGHILTGSHIVAQVKPASKVKIRLSDKRRLDATIVGRDAARNVAVLKPTGLSDPPPALPIGDSAKIAAGNWIAYIGAPFGLAGTVRQGSIGKLNTPVTLIGDTPNGTILRAIQLSAQIEPGDAGGPVLDAYGRVIGMMGVPLLPASSSDAYQPSPTGIGFALPINQSMASATHIIDNNGQAPKHATLGVVPDVTFEGPGVQILRQSTGTGGPRPVVAGSAAERAGLRPGDTITQINDERMEDAMDLIAYMLDLPAGSKVRITFQRNGVEKTVEATLGAK
ncbi:S1C family serine protease, partial [Actinomadura adrarensis]